MGACASFPKGVKEEAREVPLPEQPKDVDLTAAVAAEVAKADNEIKADGEEKEEEGGDDNKAKGEEEKAIEPSTKEGEIEAEKATVTEEEKPKAENTIAPVSPVTSDDNKETTEIKDEK